MRLNRDMWLWLGALLLGLSAFLGAIAVAYFLKEPHYSLFLNPWMPLAIVSFAAAFAARLAATVEWELPDLVKPGFPDIVVELNSVGSTDIERESGNGMDVPAHLRSFQARIVNLEAERNASLTVAMYMRLVAGSWGRAAEALCPPPDWQFPPSLGLTAMSMPLLLAPGEEAAGHLVYEVPRYYLGKLESPVRARLEITDDLTGERVSIPAVLGRYDRGAMTPAKGGAETLGPDHRPAPPGPAPAVQLPELPPAASASA